MVFPLCCSAILAAFASIKQQCLCIRIPFADRRDDLLPLLGGQLFFRWFDLPNGIRENAKTVLKPLAFRIYDGIVEIISQIDGDVGGTAIDDFH
jgi:hypothetical protein